MTLKSPALLAFVTAAMSVTSCGLTITPKQLAHLENGSGGTNANSSASSDSTSSSSSSSTSGGSNPVAGDTTSAAHWFPSTFFLNKSVRTAAVDSQSAAIMSALASRGGWGMGSLKIDFSIDVYYTDSGTVNLPFNGQQNVYLPDSDLPNTVPVPPQGGTVGFESSSGVRCDGGDCHYLVVDRTNKKLYEVDQADSFNGSFGIYGTGGLVIWDFQKAYGASLRGDVCTSADAGGFPIAPMLFTAEEVKAGTINHAIRMILPNNRIQCRTYVRPASHTTGPGDCSGWATTDGVPYGARFRLKSNYDLSRLPSSSARVVATALKDYGMILADGGNIALTAKSDRSSQTKWDLGSNDLNALQVSDFEMIEAGPRFHPPSLDCTRAP